MKIKMKMMIKIKILLYPHEYAKTVDQNERNIIIKKLNDNLDKIIDKSKSFEDQIKSIKKVENLGDCYIDDFGDKMLKFKIFKIKLANLSNYIDEKKSKQIFVHTLIKLTNKLINTTDKKENQIIVKNINANKKNLNKQEKTTPYDWVIQPPYRHVNLIKAVKFVLDYNESELKDLV